MERRQRQMMFHWSLVTGGLIALFWAIYYLINGEVPVVSTLKWSETTTITLPFALSRWFDVLIGPIYSIILVFLFTNKRVQDDKDLFIGLVFGLFTGLVFGLVTGLVFGLFIGLVTGLVAGLGTGLVFGLVTGLGTGLVFGLVTGLGTGLVFGLGTGLGTGLVFGLVTGLGVGLVTGLGVGLGVIFKVLFQIFKKNFWIRIWNWLMAR